MARRPGPLLLALLAATTAATAASRAHADASPSEPPARRGATRLELAAGFFAGRDAEVADFLAGAPDGELRLLDATLEGEVALAPALSVELALGLVERRQVLPDGSSRRAGGPGDLRLVVRTTPVRGRHRLSLHAGARAPLYERPGTRGVLAGEPARGPGGVDVLVGATWRYAICAAWWAAAELELAVRLGGPSSGVRTRVELGRTLAGPLALAAYGEGVAAYGSAAEQPLDAPAPLARRLTGGLELMLRVGRFFAALEGRGSLLVDTRGLGATLRAGAVLGPVGEATAADAPDAR